LLNYVFFLCFRARASEKPVNELILGEEVVRWRFAEVPVVTMVTVNLFALQHIHETLLGMRFRISPDAFFQVNVPAAEVVYSLVQELSTTEKPSIIYG